MKPNEHGPDKLYDKFRVFRTKTGEELTNRGEFIFVLRPETNDQAAVAALAIYADVCYGSYPELSQQIYRELTRIEDEVDMEVSEHGVSIDQAYRNIAKRRLDPPLTLTRGVPQCPHCGATEGSYCLNRARGGECELEAGNG